MKQSIKNIKTFLHILFVCLCLGLLFDSEPARAAGAEDFIITVNTEHPGTSTNTQFTIPTYTGETYNYNVDCNNDGTNEITGATEDYTCDYTSLGGVGIYTIRISDNIGDRTGFPRISFVNKDAKKLLTIEHWGTGIWTSMVSAFQGCENLQLNATDVPDLSNVTDTTLMFADASSFNGEIDNWDVSNVTNMYMMFFGADAFNQPLDNWDTSKVIYMNWMFAGASNFNQNINTWDTSSVRFMEGMFNSADAFNQPLDNWDTSSVESIQQMFYGADTFNQPIGNWDTRNVENMREMFENAGAFNQDISNWDTSKVNNMRGMFRDAGVFDQPIGSWNVTELVTATNMFDGVQLSVENYDNLLSGWSTQSVKSFVDLDAGDNYYCNGETGKAILENTYQWRIIDNGKDCTPPTVEIASPTTNSSLVRPRIIITADASDAESGLKEVQFYGYYDGAWHYINTDTVNYDGWEILWETQEVEDQIVKVKVVAVDNAGYQTEAQVDNVTLTDTHTFGNGYESRGSAEAETVTAACRVEPGTLQSPMLFANLHALLHELRTTKLQMQ